MRFSRLVAPTILFGFGFFALTQGIDSLKVEHLGVRLLTVEWLAHITAMSYHMAGIVGFVLGNVFMLSGTLISRRADKRAVANNPSMASANSIRFVVPIATLFGFAGWAVVSQWFTTRP